MGRMIGDVSEPGVQTAPLLPFVESDAGAGASVLRERMLENGYLFFRRLVPAGVILQARRNVLTCCDEAHWLDRRYDLMDAVVSPERAPTSEGQPDYMAVYRKVLKTPSFLTCPPTLR